jgi:hypothetical protein
MQCRPLAETRVWPEPAEVSSRLMAQRDRLIELLRQVPTELLTIHEPRPARGWDLVPGFIHGLHDEARHNGEMYLILKLCRARQVSLSSDRPK